MKIGVLTFHRSFNYGAFMQCFSLVTRLRRDFPDICIEVVDYSSKTAMSGYDKTILNSKPDIAKKLKARNAAFLQCQETLPLSSKSIVTDNTEEITKFLNLNYDAVIVGSDAVWNWNVRGFPNVYFLKDYAGEKFSYAASAHGLIYQHCGDEYRRYLNVAFGDFRYIGVRDITTAKLVHFANPDIEVHHNCDPTMFLDLKDIPCDKVLLEKKMNNAGVDFSKPLIGVMASDNIGYEIKKHYGDSVQLVALYAPNKYADIFLYDLTPFEWANVFSYFKVTLTHYFHGTMLSLVNGTPVIPIEFESSFSKKNVTKINDLMNRIGLSEWRHVIDTTNDNIWKRIWRKFHVPYDKEVWKSVISQIDYLMNKDCSQLIREKVLTERQTADSFFDAIRSLVTGNR